MKTRLTMLAVAAAAMFCTACEKNDGGKTENRGEPWNMTVQELLEISRTRHAHADEVEAFVNDAEKGVITVSGSCEYIYDNGECIAYPEMPSPGTAVQHVIFTADKAYVVWEGEEDNPNTGPYPAGYHAYDYSQDGNDPAVFTFTHTETGAVQKGVLHSYSNGAYIISGRFAGVVHPDSFMSEYTVVQVHRMNLDAEERATYENIVTGDGE